MTIRRLGVISCGRLFAGMYAVPGFILGAFFSLGAFMGVGDFAEESTMLAAIILFPTVYGILGFVAGIIMAALYNFVAPVTGGIEFEIESAAQEEQTALVE